MSVVKGEINNFRDILNVICERPEINFIARVISPFHASSVFASILWIEKKRNIKIKPVIVIAKHSVNGFVVNSSFFKSIDAELYYEVPKCECTSSDSGTVFVNVNRIKKGIIRVKKAIKKYSFFFKGIFCPFFNCSNCMKTIFQISM